MLKLVNRNLWSEGKALKENYSNDALKQGREPGGGVVESQRWVLSGNLSSFIATEGRTM